MITAKNLGLQIDENTILEDVSFVIKKGEYVGLIGPNGAGKTSLIKVLLGIYKPTSGWLKFSDNVRIGYVPQSYELSPVVPLSVEEVLVMSGETQKNILLENLEKVRLSSAFFSKNFHHLSGGQKQRVIIARALCQNPSLLIFDEPLNGVDLETKIKLYKLLSTLNKKEGFTILFVSHEVDHIIGDCHHILCLNKTMHHGCHPLDFATGKKDLPFASIHHHHNHNTTCSL